MPSQQLSSRCKLFALHDLAIILSHIDGRGTQEDFKIFENQKSTLLEVRVKTSKNGR